MSKIFVALAIVGATVIAAPSFAQTSKTPNTPSTAASSSTSSTTVQTATSANLWQGSKLVGLNVYNSNDEKIGDIKELMLSQDGKIDMVVIGVGGFLGMGVHDVAVKFADLKWVDQPVRSTTTSSNTRPAGTTTTTGSSTGVRPQPTTATTSSGTRHTYPDHAMLNATKDQLKAMPQFSYNK